MIFSSYVFVLLFLPLTVAGYFILSKHNHSVGKAWLLAASFVFYAYFNFSYFWILAGSLLFNFFWGLLLSQVQKQFSPVGGDRGEPAAARILQIL